MEGRGARCHPSITKRRRAAVQTKVSGRDRGSINFGWEAPQAKAPIKQFSGSFLSRPNSPQFVGGAAKFCPLTPPRDRGRPYRIRVGAATTER